MHIMYVFHPLFIALIAHAFATPLIDKLLRYISGSSVWRVSGIAAI